MATQTFIDACVLMAAARGTDDIASRAMAILDDPNREFVSSSFVKLEVLPKSVYEKQQAEAEFYEAFFDAVLHWPKSYDHIVEKSLVQAATHGLSALDALHVTTAIELGVNELITAEKPGKPLNRVTTVTVTSLRSPYHDLK